MAFRQICAYCAEEVAEEGRFVKCEDCDVPWYCGNACRDHDSEAHKHNGYCQEIKNLDDQLAHALNEYRSNSDAQDEWFRERFGDEFDGNNHDKLMAGRFSEDPFFKPVMDRVNELALKYAQHPTSAHAFEICIFGLLLLKRQTYLSDPYNLDARIVCVLLKLYREDDAISLILYWLEWRTRGPEIESLRDPVIEYRENGDENEDEDETDDSNKVKQWPFPITKDARLDDIVERLRSFPAQRVGVSVPIEFALVVLVIKMRFITVYRSRAEAETLYLHFHKGGLGLKILGSDERAHVLSYLLEGGRERYLTQQNQVNRLMDYIDERDATLLPALVDRRIRRGRNAICFRTFLKEYANGAPVVDTIKCTLRGRYFDRKPPVGCTAATRNNNKRSAETDGNLSSQKLARQGEE